MQKIRLFFAQCISCRLDLTFFSLFFPAAARGFLLATVELYKHNIQENHDIANSYAGNKFDKLQNIIASNYAQLNEKID